MKKQFRFLSLVLMTLLSIGCSQNPEKKAAKHLKKGEEYVKASKYREAIIEFKDALQATPKNAQAHYQAGLVYIRLGGMSNLQTAFQELSNAVELDPNILDAQIKLGEMYVISREADKAKGKAEFVLTKDPKNIEARMILATVHAGNKDFAKAISLLEEAAVIAPASIKPHMAMAAVYLGNNELASAENAYKKAITINKDAIDPRLGLANLYMKQNRLGDAEAELKKAVELNPKSEEIVSTLAKFYASTNKVDEAEKSYQEVIALKPENPNGYLLLAGFYQETGKAEMAEETCKKGIDMAPDAVVLKHRLAEILLDEKKNKEAASYIDAILKKNAKDYYGLYLRGKLDLAERKVNEATDALRTSTKEEPNFPLAHYYLGLVYQATNDFQQSKAELNETLKLAPGMDAARLALANLYMISDDSELAFEETEKVLLNHPFHPGANLMAGNLKLRNKKPDEAAVYFRMFMKSQPDDPRGYAGLGETYRMKGNYRDAIGEFEKALSIKPDLVDVLSMIAAMHLANKEPRKAIDRVQAQLDKLPDNPFIHYLKGRIYMLTNNLDEAEKSMKKTLSLKNDLVSPYIDLGNIYARKGAVEEAKKQFEQAIKANPKAITPYMQLGVTYERQMKTDKAIEYYKKALDIDPKFAPAANNLAWLYAEHGGNIDVALSLAETAKEQQANDPSISDTLGWIYLKKGAYLKAIALFKESLDKLPDNPSIHYHLGMAYYEKGDKKFAKEELIASLKISDKYPESEDARKVLSELK